MNAEQALFILFPMVAVPLGLIVVLVAALQRSLAPIFWFNAAFAVAALPLLIWNIASTLAEFESWRDSQPDLTIGLDQYPYGQGAAIVAEILLLAITFAALRGRGQALARVAAIIGFTANLTASAIPLSFVVMLTLWPINRLM